jgi:large repetitive protein
VTLTATVTGGGSGYWTTLGKGVVKDQSNNVTEVDDLVTGKNTFVWTSSAPGCPDFAADTITVFVEKGLNAKDDLVTQKNKSEYFTVPVTINDDIKGIKAWTLKAITKPEYGNLDTAATKTGFRYKPSDCYAGNLSFKYVITSKYCPQYTDTATVKLLITSDPASCNDVTIPNTITPNGDGLNDGFRIDAIEFQPERFKNAELIVFNRWGDIVYKKKPYKNEWQGTNQDGKDLPEGTYYYLLDLNLPDGVNFRGDITILR